MKSLVFPTLLLIALVSGIASAPSGAADAKPNIVFIMADDLGWADTTLHGHTKFYLKPNVAPPASGPSGIVWLRLPAKTQPVNVDWITLQSGTETRRSDS
jgi:hypothetical protein